MRWYLKAFQLHTPQCNLLYHPLTAIHHNFKVRTLVRDRKVYSHLKDHGVHIVHLNITTINASLLLKNPIPSRSPQIRSESELDWNLIHIRNPESEIQTPQAKQSKNYWQKLAPARTALDLSVLGALISIN